jgi:hypothetical protein
MGPNIIAEQPCVFGITKTLQSAVAYHRNKNICAIMGGTIE